MTASTEKRVDVIFIAKGCGGVVIELGRGRKSAQHLIKVSEVIVIPPTMFISEGHPTPGRDQLPYACCGVYSRHDCTPRWPSSPSVLADHLPNKGAQLQIVSVALAGSGRRLFERFSVRWS